MISSSVIENTLLLILVSQHIHTFFRAEKGCGQKKLSSVDPSATFHTAFQINPLTANVPII